MCCVQVYLSFRGSHRKGSRVAECVQRKKNNNSYRKVRRESEKCWTHGHFNHHRTEDIVWLLNHPLMETPFQTQDSKLNQSQPSTKATRTYHEVKVKFIPHTTKVYILWPLKKQKKKSSFPWIEITIDAAKTCLKVFLITRNDPQAVTPIRCSRLPRKCTLKTPPTPPTPPQHRRLYNKIYKKEKKKQNKETHIFAWVFVS